MKISVDKTALLDIKSFQKRKVMKKLCFKRSLYHNWTSLAAAKVQLQGDALPLSETVHQSEEQILLTLKQAVQRAPRHFARGLRSRGGGSKREGGRKGENIILVNALAALTSATSRCTRPTPRPDSFQALRTYRTRVGACSCTVWRGAARDAVGIPRRN